MNRLICSSLVAASLCTASLAQAATPVAASVAGSWKVSFYLENSRTTGATQCIVFNTANGAVSGVPTSGTWASATFPGWQGQWIQLGDHVRWVGVTSTLATQESGNISNANNFEGVSFNHFNKNTGVSSSAGAWHAVRVSSCTGMTVGEDNTDDPSK